MMSPQQAWQQILAQAEHDRLAARRVEAAIRAVLHLPAAAPTTRDGVRWDAVIQALQRDRRSATELAACYLRCYSLAGGHVPDAVAS